VSDAARAVDRAVDRAVILGSGPPPRYP